MGYTFRGDELYIKVKGFREGKNNDNKNNFGNAFYVIEEALRICGWDGNPDTLDKYMKLDA